MSDAIKELHDYLAKSPSVVYPEDVLAYLPAIEAENSKLRELGEQYEAVTASYRSEVAKLRKLVRDYDEFVCWTDTRVDNWEHQEFTRRWLALADRMRELGVEVDE